MELPTSNRGLRKFSEKPEARICSALKKRAVEVNEKKLTKEEAMKFGQAKHKEVRNFVAAQCFDEERQTIP